MLSVCASLPVKVPSGTYPRGIIKINLSEMLGTLAQVSVNVGYHCLSDKNAIYNPSPLLAPHQNLLAQIIWS